MLILFVYFKPDKAPVAYATKSSPTDVNLFKSNSQLDVFQPLLQRNSRDEGKQEDANIEQARSVRFSDTAVTTQPAAYPNQTTFDTRQSDLVLNPSADQNYVQYSSFCCKIDCNNCSCRTCYFESLVSSTPKSIFCCYLCW